jgi:hypothetical protein
MTINTISDDDFASRWATWLAQPPGIGDAEAEHTCLSRSQAIVTQPTRANHCSPESGTPEINHRRQEHPARRP